MSQNADYERPPLFYPARKTDGWIAIVTACAITVAHRAFGQGLHACIDAVGLGSPSRIERSLNEPRSRSRGR
jgi:hypothetical protein